jgi:hypothetical protein
MQFRSANALARRFKRKRCWAAIIDVRAYRFVREYGVRFAELVAARNAASQGVSIRPRPKAARKMTA